MPDFSGDPQDIVLYKINIKDGVYDQYDDQSTDPPCPLGFIQDHEPD
jgi:hypothetical protein